MIKSANYVCLCVCVYQRRSFANDRLSLSHFYRHHLVSIDVECSAASENSEDGSHALGMSAVVAIQFLAEFLVVCSFFFL